MSEEYPNLTQTKDSLITIKLGIMGQTEIGKLAERLENNKFIYIGLFLTDASREKLLEAVEIPQGCHIYAEHCTLLFARTQGGHRKADDVKQECFDSFINKGDVARLLATHVGRNGKAVAVKVLLGGISCCNETPHITVCTIGSGKPSDSNAITDWQELPRPVMLEAEWRVV